MTEQETFVAERESALVAHQVDGAPHVDVLHATARKTPASFQRRTKEPIAAHTRILRSWTAAVVAAAMACDSKQATDGTVSGEIPWSPRLLAVNYELGAHHEVHGDKIVQQLAAARHCIWEAAADLRRAIVVNQHTASCQSPRNLTETKTWPYDKEVAYNVLWRMVSTTS